MEHLSSIQDGFPRRGARVWYDAARERPVVRIGFLQRGVRCKPGFREESHRWLLGISPTPAPTRDRAVDARRLHPALRLVQPEEVIVKLREWSRMADELQQERARLASRMREQLWRYYPQMLELADDLAADCPELELGHSCYGGCHAARKPTGCERAESRARATRAKRASG